MHLIEQWCNEVDLFALQSDFCFNLLDPHKYFTVFYNDNKCCSILSLIVKIKLKIKKFLPVMPRKFSDDLFALKKCCILHIENLTINKKHSGIKL